MHPGPGVATLELVAVLALLGLAIRHRQTLARALRRVLARIHPPPPRPDGRPIELIALDARRLRIRFRYPPRGVRFAKYEGLRCAYDAVLAEACGALGHPHLFDVLPPGSERDAERDRLEALLDGYGFHLVENAV